MNHLHYLNEIKITDFLVLQSRVNYYGTHQCVWWIAANVAAPGNDDVPTLLTMARDGFPGFALEGSGALGPVALASMIASANPCHLYSLASPPAPTPAVAAAAAEYRRDRGDHVHHGNPDRSDEAATAVAMPRRAVCPAACPDVTT